VLPLCYTPQEIPSNNLVTPGQCSWILPGSDGPAKDPIGSPRLDPPHRDTCLLDDLVDALKLLNRIDEIAISGKLDCVMRLGPKFRRVAGISRHGNSPIGRKRVSGSTAGG